MEFYYPNWNNDMWGIAGFLFFNDKDYFVDKTKTAFCKERLISFLQEKGIALFDTCLLYTSQVQGEYTNYQVTMVIKSKQSYDEG